MKDMSEYDGKIFLEVGTWYLLDNPLQHYIMNPTNSRVVHYCAYNNDNPSVWTGLANLKCEWCGGTMPVDIQTAFALHNFDITPFEHDVTTTSRSAKHGAGAHHGLVK